LKNSNSSIHKNCRKDEGSESNDTSKTAYFFKQPCAAR
jgi:hypothetical protein